MKKYIDIVNEYFSDKKVKELLLRQIELYNLEKENSRQKSSYKIGDNVKFEPKTLLHGSRISIENLHLIENTGLISPEFYGDINLNKKKPWIIEFWKINEEISLKNYIAKYCGCTIEVRDRDGKIIKNIVSSFVDLERNIKNIKDINYRDYIIVQNMEQRFLPNDYTNHSTMAFVINAKNENQNELISKNILDRNYDLNIQKELFAQWFIEKYFETKSYDNNETNRGVAYLFGVPSSMIEGIIVNREIENNAEDIAKIKQIFPECYIANINGIVIR